MIKNKLLIYIIIIFILITLIFIIKNKNKNIETLKEHEQLHNIVVVEPRNHTNLEYFINHIIDKFPNTPIQIFHSNKNKDKLEKLRKNLPQIKLVNIYIDNFSFKEYNKYVSSKKFWEQVHGENILFMELDSCLCNNSDKNISNFLEYDYVGSPYKNRPYGGNSGFSLRKKSKMIKFIDKCKYKGKNTDDYFTSSCNNYNLNIPSSNESKYFGFETVYDENIIPIGVHKPWGYLNQKDYANLKKKCPCLNIIDKY